MKLMNAAMMTFARPGTEMETRVIIVRKEVSRMNIQIIWKKKDNKTL